MADKVNTQSVFTDKTFITLDTLSYFWTKTKTHVDNLVNPISTDVVALKDTVGDATKGLVKEVASLRADVTALGSGEGGIQGMIDNSIATLDLPNTYDAKGAAATAKAEAIAHANGLASNYDAAGSASAAEAAAKTYADGLGVKYDAAGAAAEVDGKLTTHAADTVAHVTADERTAWNNAKTAIDAFLKDADMSEKAVDTLAELQTYMTTDGAAAAQVVERIGALEAINHNAYIAADETVLASAKSYAEGLASNYDTAGAAAQALADAKADAANLYQPKGNYEAAGAAATAKAEAIADAEGKYQPKGDYEAAGTADAKIAALKLPESYDAKGSADAAQAAAITQAKADATAALASYYTKTEVDNLLSTNSTGDRAYAKQYTDELYKSFVFAQSSDIDAIFAATNV
jgi:hypothetical protein